jgi:hypothetical protein
MILRIELHPNHKTIFLIQVGFLPQLNLRRCYPGA